jgi:hypothetical protein
LFEERRPKLFCANLIKADSSCRHTGCTLYDSSLKSSSGGEL